MARGKDPLTILIVAVMLLVFAAIWRYVTNYMSTEEGAEFSAAEILFIVFLILAAVGAGLRFGIKAVFGA